VRPIWTVPALLAVAFGVVACDTSGTKPGNVPKVEGEAQASAEAKLRKACPEAQIRYEPAEIVTLAGKQKVNMANVVVLSQDIKLTGAAPAPSRAPSASPLPRPSGRGCSDSGTLTVTLKLAVKVPQLVGEPVENAQVLLQQSGLAPADKPAAGHHVLTQKPAFGEPVPLTKIPAGIVELGLDVRVPNVVNRTTKDACARLTQAGLACDPKDVTTTLVVQNQTPAGDTFALPGSLVRFGSKPPGTIQFFAMPNVVGKGSMAACDILEGRQLTCEVRESDTYGDDPFAVIKTDPEPGAQVAAGVHATIFVPQPRKVPLLKGLDQAHACQLVKDVGLACTFDVVAEIGPAGTVVDQSPSEGKPLRKGELVTIKIASGVGVPYVIGLTVREACRQLYDNQLACESGTYDLDWIVTGQSVEAGQPAKRLDRVTLTAAHKTCDGIKFLGQCTDMITLVTTALAAGGFLIAVLEFRRRRGRKEEGKKA
jgi:beta-lactam-binding protein with PASTA domain